MKKLALSSLLVASVFNIGCATQSAPSEPTAAIKLAAAANKAGIKIGDQATATLTITKYNNRSLFTRFVIGPIGIFFRDEIQATVEIDSRQLTVDENVMIPLRGIESVARKVG